MDSNDPDLTTIIYVNSSGDFEMIPDIAWVRLAINANFFQVNIIF